MRSEQAMYDLILGYARAHDDIRAVVMNGSRANPARKPDPFNDFDIVYLVRDVAAYKEKPIHTEFGSMLVYERTDRNSLFHEDFPEYVCYLMQFADGNRIDLTIADVENYRGYCFDDRLSVVLLDKDGRIPPLPAPDESTHYIVKPTAQMFFECRTEFWWVAPYVSKGLWRGQLLFAQSHMELCIRKMLLQMLAWYAGTLHGFDRSAGKCGDGLRALLPAELWSAFLETFAPCEEAAIWASLYKAGTLFTDVSRRVADALGFTIDDTYDAHVTAFLRYTEALPRDAKTIDFTLPEGGDRL